MKPIAERIFEPAGIAEELGVNIFHTWPTAIRALRSAIRQQDSAAVRKMLDILIGTASLT